MNTIARLTVVLLLLGILYPFTTACSDSASPESLVSFNTFRKSLENAITKSGGDAQNSAYHFAVIMNTVRTNGPRARAIRDLYNGLLNQYMVEDGKITDEISFSPFELDLWGKSVWNNKFRRNEITDLYALAPKAPQVRNDSQGGHDDERALLAALNRIASRSSTLLIILSDSEVSEPPVHPDNYKLTVKTLEFPKMLEETGFGLVTRGRIEGRNADALGRPVPFAVFYSIYSPVNLKPLTNLGNWTRSEMLAKVLRKHSVPPSSVYNEDINKNTSNINWVAFFLIILAILLVIPTAWYWSYLNKPRFVQIGSAQGVIRLGRHMYIGGDETDQQCIPIPEINNLQKVAVLEVQMPGNVVIRNHGAYHVSSPGARDTIVLTKTEKTISIKNTQTSSIIQFKARIISG